MGLGFRVYSPRDGREGGTEQQGVPGSSLLQHSLLQADDVPFPSHATAEGFALQPTEAGPCHIHLAPSHTGVKVEVEADLLNFPSQRRQLQLI